MLPKLQSLILTDLPSHTISHEVSRNLISFICACAEEAHAALVQSQYAYALPPGRDRNSAEKTYAKSLFSLRRLVLEVKHVTPTRKFGGLSSVEDPDCEDFWTEGANDFSFFGPGNEECGQPEVGIEKRIPLEALMGKMVVDEKEKAAPGLSRWASGPRVNSVSGASPGVAPIVDVLAEVSKFRKEKKATYLNALTRGEVYPYVEGYWEGEIIVMRLS